MYNPRFEKDVFKRDVRNNVKTLFRKEVEEATPQQLFHELHPEITSFDYSWSIVNDPKKTDYVGAELDRKSVV